MAELITLDTTIEGPVDLTARQIMRRLDDDPRPHVYDEPTRRNFAEAAIYWTAQFGWRTSVIVAQMLHETGNLRFGGDVVPEQFNFGGIGTTGGGVRGHSFDSVSDGVLAVCAHTAVYVWGTVDKWPEPLRKYQHATPRYQNVLSAGYGGVVKTIGSYTNGRWAHTASLPVGTLDNGYAHAIVRGANRLLNYPANGDAIVSVAQRYGIRGLIDSRSKLATNANGGPTNRRPLSQKRGKVVVHYAGGNQNLNRTDLQLWQSYASWHVRPDGFGRGHTGNGIMYHVGIGRDGSKHLLYDIEADRWHCGSWPENGTHLSINVPIGGTQRATEKQLTALREVVDDWVGGGNRSQVIGHQEVDWTACPGTLQTEFVHKYREDVRPVADGMFFEQTGKFVGHGFWRFWRENGGIRIFGLPLTDEHEENGITVQYFERARFEWQPAIADNPHGVVLGLVGTEVLKAKNAA